MVSFLLCGIGVAERRYPMSNVQSGGGEEVPHIQSQEQQLRGDTPHPRSGEVAVRRYPMSNVRKNPYKMVGDERGQQRADRLKP